MTPYEALYGRPSRSPVYWTEVGEKLSTGLYLVRDTCEKVDLIQNLFSRLRADKRATLIDGGDL